VFRSLTEGYLDKMRNLLSPIEKDHLVYSFWLLSVELTSRFLGDYLNGDAYFKVDKEDRNLHRARVQCELAEAIENRWGELNKITKGLE
tara:strand:+ start:19074 stop:19340 length:267 start_codon:yes stop_codon:yes gene_type:complete